VKEHHATKIAPLMALRL